MLAADVGAVGTVGAGNVGDNCFAVFAAVVLAVVGAVWTDAGAGNGGDSCLAVFAAVTTCAVGAGALST